MDQIAALWKRESSPWINWLHLACVFMQRQVQPIQNRLRPMWEYSGRKYATRTRADELSPDEFDTRIRAITNIVGEATPVLPTRPFGKGNLPTVVIIESTLVFIF